MADDQAKKDELLRLLSDVEPEAARLEAMGQGLIQAARLSRDVATPMREIIGNMPAGTFSSGQLDLGLDVWRNWHDAAGQVQGTQPFMNSFSVAASGAINTTVSGVIAFVPSTPPPPPPVETARTHLFRNIEKAPRVDAAKASMRRLGLDRRGGTSQPAMALLEQAETALATPVSSAGGESVPVLIAMRECIDAALAELIRRRPVQETASKAKEKVESLARHCARPVPPGHFQRLASDVAEPRRDELSGAKQNVIPRTRVTELFHWGLSFLIALMDGIDESKLRP